MFVTKYRQDFSRSVSVYIVPSAEGARNKVGSLFSPVRPFSFLSFCFFFFHFFLPAEISRPPAGRFNQNGFTEPGSSYEYTRPLPCPSYHNYIHLRRHLRCSRMGSLGCQDLRIITQNQESSYNFLKKEIEHAFLNVFF